MSRSFGLMAIFVVALFFVASFSPTPAAPVPKGRVYDPKGQADKACVECAAEKCTYMKYFMEEVAPLGTGFEKGYKYVLKVGMVPTDVFNAMTDVARPEANNSGVNYINAGNECLDGIEAVNLPVDNSIIVIRCDPGSDACVFNSNLVFAAGQRVRIESTSVGKTYQPEVPYGKFTCKGSKQSYP